MTDTSNVSVSAPPVEDPAAALRTFMIADVRGYTRFTLERGDEAGAELAIRFAALARESASARGGSVVELRGDEAFAVFPSARQALRAAIEFQVRCADQGRADPLFPLPVGIGLDAGEAVSVEGGYRGSAINLASRLCSLAGPGEVLASEGVIHLARRTEGLLFAERGLVELKGFVDPVRVIHVSSGSRDPDEPLIAPLPPGALQREAKLPIGGFLGSLPSGELIARDEEMTRILPALDAVEEGTGQIVLLAGDRGVGKTRLAQEITLKVRDRGFIVATGRCYQQERSIPFFPFFEALAMAYAASPLALRAPVGRRWPDLARLLPDHLAAGHSTAPTQDDPQRLFRAVTGFLTALAGERTVALMLDDLQWADESSLRLLLHIARTLRGARLLIVGTYRDADLARDAPLDCVVHDLARDRLADRIAVRRLSGEGTAALVASIIGDTEASAEFAEYVHRRTKGNPLYIEEILRALAGRYRLVREIGAGGMGRVFQAFDSHTNSAVAAKIMFASRDVDLDALLRFQQEGAVLSTLKHPNIVRVYSTFLEEHASVIIMELLDGQPLDKALASGGLDLPRIKALARQVTSALAYAHGNSIVHRDIKPDNIMVLRDDRVKVTDFGIARVVREEASTSTMMGTGMTLGTPLYSAPEQIEGRKVDGRADIYALGAVLYQLLTGRPPFEGDDPLTVAYKHVHQAPTPPGTINPDVPADWAALVLKALAKSPADRFPSAAALQEGIDALSTDVGSAAIGGRFRRSRTPMPRTPVPSTNEQRGADGNGVDRAAAGATDLIAAAAPIHPAVLPVSPPPSVRSRWLRRAGPLTWLLAAGGAGVIAFIVTIVFLHRSTAPEVAASDRPIAIFGARSSHGERFQQPVGLARDARGTIYVADQIANRIQAVSSTGAAIAVWGAAGAGAGQLSGPAGVATDSDGHIYVADTGNNRIQKFTSDGAFLAEWGPNGAKPAHFGNPLGVAVDGRGTVYVADTSNGQGRIQRFTSEGAFLGEWSGGLHYPTALSTDSQGDVFVADGQDGLVREFSSTGTMVMTTRSGSFRGPNGLAVDTRGAIYVADTGNNRVAIVSADGKTIRPLGGSRARASHIKGPYGVVIGSGGDLYVSDGDHHIDVLSAAGNLVQRWAGSRPAVALLAQPAAVAVDSRGGIYIADSPTSGGRLVKLLSAGTPDPTFRWASTPGQVSQPSGVAIDPGGNLFVVDSVNSTLQEFSPGGRLLPRIRGYSPELLSSPLGVGVDRQGNIYMADAGNDRVVKITPSTGRHEAWGDPGVLLGQFSHPAGVAIDGQGNVYVTDATNNSVQKWTSGGTPVALWNAHGSLPGQFDVPQGVAVDDQGNVYVADTNNNRVQELTSDGKVLHIWGRPGSGPGEFREPEGVTVDARGNIYVADTGNGRIQEFGPAG